MFYKECHKLSYKSILFGFFVFLFGFFVFLFGFSLLFFTLLFGVSYFVSVSYLGSVKENMEPFDKNLISIIKKNLKEIGELTLPLCRNDDSHTEDVARDINKLAHDTYELIWLAENSIKKEIDMKTLKEKGVPTLKL